MEVGGTTPMPLLSVVLPGYNEEEAVGPAVETYLESLTQAGLDDFEIILVNDGSTDRTGERADELSRRDGRIRVIHHARNQGQSAAFLHGFAESRGRVVTWNGMDLPFHPADTHRALTCIRTGADVVVIERRNRAAYGLVRKAISWANVLLLRWLFASTFRDHNFVQFFRREVLAGLPIVSRGVSTVTAELIVRAVRAGLPRHSHDRRLPRPDHRPQHDQPDTDSAHPRGNVPPLARASPPTSGARHTDCPVHSRRAASMRRSLTNLARNILDEYLPPILRDNRRFMTPFFRYWFAGTPDMAAVMDFKERVHALSDRDLADFYHTLRCRANDRPTDASEASLTWILNRLDPKSMSLLDVGCGRGYWATRCADLGLSVTGCDLVHACPNDIAFREANAEHLPFADRSFDVVTCLHVLEHVPRLHTALAELRRVCRRQLFIIVPCQRSYRYTLDLHVHFFHSPAHFLATTGVQAHECRLVNGDIVCLMEVESTAGECS